MVRIRKMEPFTLEDIIVKEDGYPIALSYIAGKWEKGCGQRFEVVDATTNKVIGFSYDSSVAQVEKSFKAARKSQEYWRFNVNQQEKEKIFKRITQKLEEKRPEISLMMARRGIKPIIETDSDVREACDTIEHYTGELSRNRGDFEECQLPDKIALTLNEPYEVVAGITPWNFPIAIPCWKTFATLAAGGAIVLKDAEQTPFETTILVKIIHEAIEEILGKERAEKVNSLVQLLHGRGETTGEAVVSKADYELLSFTGGVETAKIIRQTMAKNSKLKPDHYELGGKNAMIVMDDFDINLAVGEAINAAYGTSGQRCVSLSRIYVHEDIFEEFVAKFKEAALKFRIGSPFEIETKMGPLVSKEQLEKVHGFVQRAEKEGFKPKVGGYKLNKETASRAKEEGFNFTEEDFKTDKCGNGNFYLPTVFLNLPQESEMMQREVFGPVVVINSFKKKSNKKETLETAIALVNDTKYGLSNSLLTNDMRLIFYAIPRMKSGILYIGRGTTGAELNKYFGGLKESGWGREGRGVESFTEKKQVYIDFHGKPRMPQIGLANEILSECAKAIAGTLGEPIEISEATTKASLQKILEAYERKAK